MYEITIEVLDGAFPASSWRSAHGDSVTTAALSSGASDWKWIERGWGVILEIAFGNETQYETFRGNPAVVAALDAVPGRVHVQRGWGGSSGGRFPRRRKPLAGAGGAAVPLPEPDEPLEDAVAGPERDRLARTGRQRVVARD